MRSSPGPFSGVVVLGLLGAAALSFLRIPDGPEAGHPADMMPARPLVEIASQRRFLVGLLCGVGTFSLMSFIMTGCAAGDGRPRPFQGYEAFWASSGTSWRCMVRASLPAG